MWHDLTIPKTETVRDFYAAVAGWTPEEVVMPDRTDYTMKAANGETVAGICHPTGENADLPAQWLLYITVADLKKSLKLCVKKGGKILKQPADAGQEGSYAVVEDPAGAVCALFQS